MLDLIWRSSADDQLDAIVDFISIRHPSAADRLLRLIHDGVDRVQKFPESGRPGRVRGTRELIVHPNYVVVYRATVEGIVVLRILHARQRYP